MKTIDIKTGDQIAQFTTRSVTYDGMEFFYSRMQALKHDPENHAYFFVYDNQPRIFTYEPKDAKILNAIFSQVKTLRQKEEPKPEPPAEERFQVRNVMDGQTEAPEEPQPAAEEPVQEEIPAGEDLPVQAEEPVQEEPAAEKEIDDGSKKKRLRKGLLIFAAIIAIVAVLGVIYYFVIGTSNDASDMNVDESQQYDNIDEMIDDLE